MKNSMKFLRKRIWWWLGGLIFLYPFYCPLFYEWTGFKLIGFNKGEFYTFGLELKDFMTVWIALGGIIVVVSHLRLTQNRIDNQDKQLRETRFSTGVKLLGNLNESARIGGAYNLYYLTNDFEEYREPACEILCAHIRAITGKKEYQAQYKNKPANEIQTILNLLFQERYQLNFDGCWKDLGGALLNGSNFNNAVLNNVDFRCTALSHVEIMSAALSNVVFWRSALSEVDFENAAISGVDFENAILKDVGFRSVALSNVSFVGAALSDVDFKKSKLTGVDFMDTTLSDVDFSNAKFEGEIDFRGTVLYEIPVDEITNWNCSRILTKPKGKKEKPQFLGI
jgi:hypothetical protein